jgi:sugar lactone lactonase YvrE
MTGRLTGTSSPRRIGPADSGGAPIKRYVAAPVCDLRCRHGEGPAWDAELQELLWVDQHAGLLHVGRLREGVVVVERTLAVDAPVGAVVPIADRRQGWLAAAGRGFGRLARDGRQGAVVEAPNLGAVRMNDGKCDPAGTFWAGSMAVDSSAGGGSLYRLGPSGRITRVLTNVGISNGLAWSAGRRQMYYIDSLTRRVDVLQLDDGGSPRSREMAFRVPEESGSPDGMCMDEEGMLWIALWGGGAVQRYAPDGTLLARVEVAAAQTTSCAFGGTDGRTLFITTSREGYGEAELSRWPNAGRLFAVRLPVAGPPAAAYRGPLTFSA